MACCAFAAFLIGQLVYGLQGLWNRLRGVAEDKGAPVLDAAAAWRLGAPAAVAAAPAHGLRGWRPALFAGAVAAELAVLAAGGFALARPGDPLHGVAILCHADHLRTAALGSLVRADIGENSR